MQTALLNIMFVGHQFELNPKEEVQQYMNNEVDDILHFDDRAVFSLNANDVFFPALFIQSNEICTQYISFDTRTKLFPVSDLP